MCLYPRLIKNKRYIANKKNGGNVPICDDKRKLVVPVGCGNCMECRKKKSREWQTRMLEDIRHNKNGKFITLTFSNESITDIIKEIKGLEGYELDNEIATRATRYFLERWRKKYKKSLRHWLITELGHNGTENIHMHGIVWTNEKMEEVEKHWQYGYVWKGNETQEGGLENYVSERTVSYLTKYVTKQDELHKEYKPKILSSPGIGKNYTERIDFENNKYKGEETKEYYKTRTGHKMAMPIYWRNKAYTEEEREKLWIQKLDKEERWVGGEKVDISKGEEEYYKLLEYYRGRNKRLGYGDNEINWERKKYELERRILKIQERIIKEDAPQAGDCPPVGREHTDKYSAIKPSNIWD